MLKLKNSGNSTKYRTEILDSALTAFENMVKEDKAGTKPLFRDRNWKKEETGIKDQKQNINLYCLFQ